MSGSKKTVRSDNEEKRIRKETVLKLGLLVLVTAGVFGFYRIMMTLKYFEIVLGAYLVAMTVLIVVYIVYNRGFSRRNMTCEMLPDEWSYDEKVAYIEDGRQRLKRSSWMLMLILAFTFTFAFDLFELYFIPWLERIVS